MMYRKAHAAVAGLHDFADLVYQFLPAFGAGRVHQCHAAHALQPVKGHLAHQVFHQLIGDVAYQMVAVGAAAGIVQFGDAVQAEADGQALLPGLAQLIHPAEHGGGPGEVGYRVHHEIVVLVCDPPGKEQGLGFVLAPF